MKKLNIHFHKRTSKDENNLKDKYNIHVTVGWWKRTRPKLESFLISLFTRTSYVHVGMSDDVTGLIVTVCGKVVRFSSHYYKDAWNDYDTLTINVPDHFDINNIYESSKNLYQWGLLNHITFGMMSDRSCDCVSMAKRALCEGGLYVPRSITSPVKLKRYLETHYV